MMAMILCNWDLFRVIVSGVEPEPQCFVLAEPDPNRSALRFLFWIQHKM
jgi:hypothetical protein